MNHLQVDTPGWDTKQRCECGYESPSKCEQWKHQADKRLQKITDLEEAVREFGCHDIDCDFLKDCKCGFTAALAILSTHTTEESYGTP